MRLATVFGLLVLAASVHSASAQPAQRALGVWADEHGKSHIEIAPCGDYLCGRIVWLKDPTDASGWPKTDIENPDRLLRNRPILGLVIIEGLHPDEDNARLEGQVYNAEDGKIYDLYLDPRDQTMSVEGCFFMFLCGSQTWTRIR